MCYTKSIDIIHMVWKRFENMPGASPLACPDYNQGNKHALESKRLEEDIAQTENEIARLSEYASTYTTNQILQTRLQERITTLEKELTSLQAQRRKD